MLKTTLAFVRQRPLAVATTAVLTGLFIQAVTKRSGDWIPVYVEAARRLLAGEDIYQGIGYAYPPFMAMIVTPFVFLPPLAIRVTFFAMCALCAVMMVRAAWRIAAGPPIDDPQPWRRQEWAIFLFGLLCGGPYILNTFNVQQSDLLIGALLIGGCHQLLQGQQVSGGALVGLAAACKLTPLLFCPYLFFRRQWMAGTVVGAVALAVNLLPNLVSTPPQGGLWLTHWISGSVVQGSDQTLGAVSGRMGVLTNLSLSGTTHRVINTDLAFRGGRLDMVERPTVSLRHGRGDIPGAGGGARRGFVRRAVDRLARGHAARIAAADGGGIRDCHVPDVAVVADVELGAFQYPGVARLLPGANSARHARPHAVGCGRARGSAVRPDQQGTRA